MCVCALVWGGGWTDHTLRVRAPSPVFPLVCSQGIGISSLSCQHCGLPQSPLSYRPLPETIRNMMASGVRWMSRHASVQEEAPHHLFRSKRQPIHPSAFLGKSLTATFVEAISRHASAGGSRPRPALICGVTGRTREFADVLRRVGQYQALQCRMMVNNAASSVDEDRPKESGIRKVSAILADNCLDYVSVFHAILAEGGVVSTLNPVSPPFSIARQLWAGSVECLFVQKAYVELAKQATSADCWNAVAGGHLLPSSRPPPVVTLLSSRTLRFLRPRWSLIPPITKPSFFLSPVAQRACQKASNSPTPTSSPTFCNRKTFSAFMRRTR